ncbi:SDR family NAD(P)-dependent oxidoreductase [Brevundimonas sp. GCM10030266]|uniref:SDR family NAD(P)-dependent oxidoreductase n=1 Tax=Brevundimonas sp. GCM10030266 TaxID=3273386 RepID=UPI00361F52FB
MKTALIVGASRGIGLGLAKEYLDRGWTVHATVRNDAGEAALKTLDGADRLTVHRADVTSDADISALGKAMTQPLDLLFLNAGIISSAHDKGQDTAWLGEFMQTNAFGPVRAAWNLIDQVRETTGVIAFMSSAMGSITENVSGGSDLYRASKTAQNMLARSLWAGPGRRRGVTVLSVNPGWVQTDMGGPGATIDVTTSARGIVDEIEANTGSGEHRFVSWNGQNVPW